MCLYEDAEREVEHPSPDEMPFGDGHNLSVAAYTDIIHCHGGWKWMM